MNISEIVGKTFVAVDATDDTVDFVTNEGEHYRMFHSQDCCEHVYLQDISGELTTLLNTPILRAEKVTSNEKMPWIDDKYAYDESFTWTFYNIDTIKGYVQLRWLGTSNGYYSEDVEFEQIGTNDRPIQFLDPRHESNDDQIII